MSVKYSPLCDVSEVAYLAYVYALTNGGSSTTLNARAELACRRVGQRRIAAVAKECFDKVAGLVGECGGVGDGVSESRCVCGTQRSEFCGRTLSSSNGESVRMVDGEVAGSGGKCGSSEGCVGVAGPGVGEQDDVAGVGLEREAGSRVEGTASGDGGDRRSGASETLGDSGCAGQRDDGKSCGPVVSEKTLANREKRRKAKAAKLRKQAEAKVVKESESAVPEWRRNGGVGVHKGAFAECSQGVQLALRESRAQMLIAKNKAAVVEAEERARRTAAMLKSRLIEENVEKERLELEGKMKGLRESTALPQGYCETVLSALATPSLSDGTVSPDSSISSAEVHRKDEAIKMLVNQRDEQRRRADSMERKSVDSEKAVKRLTDEFEKFKASVHDRARERARKERADMFAGRQAEPSVFKWDEMRAARDSGAREYSGGSTTKIVWSTDAEV